MSNDYRREIVLIQDKNHKVVKSWWKYVDEEPKYQIYKIETHLGMNMADTILPALNLEEIDFASEIFDKILQVEKVKEKLDPISTTRQQKIDNNDKDEKILLESWDYKVTKRYPYGDTSPEFQIYEIEKQLDMDIADTFLSALDIKKITFTHKLFKKLLEIEKDSHKYIDKKRKMEKFNKMLCEGDLIRLLNERNIKVRNTYIQLNISRTNNIYKEVDMAACNEKEIIIFDIKTYLNQETLEDFLHKLKDFKQSFNFYAEGKNRLWRSGLFGSS